MPRKKERLSLDERASLPLAKDNPNFEYLRFNRQQICKAEITSAVRLFLLDDDLISAHLLASASIEIMGALSNGQDGVGLNDIRAFLKGASISPDLEQEAFNSLMHPYNFLKHSSSNFNIENDFCVEYIVMTIYSAIHSYKILFSDLSFEMKVFYGITQAWRAEWWKESPDFAQRQHAAQQFGLIDASRERFSECGRHLLQQARR